MGGKRYSTEQIIVKLREAEIEMGRGVKVPEVCRKLGISEQTFYRWRKRYGGLDRSEVRRLKALEQENARLKKLLAESLIDNAIRRCCTIRSRRESGRLPSPSFHDTTA